MRIKQRGTRRTAPRTVNWRRTPRWPGSWRRSLKCCGRQSRSPAGSSARIRTMRTTRCHTRPSLRFSADYVRGRRMKTEVVLQPDGSGTLSTMGRGKAAILWLERLKGKKRWQVVQP